MPVEQTFVQRRGGEYPDAALTAEITRLGRQLGKHSQRPELSYAFTVLDQTESELQIFPTGHIMLTRGLLSRMDNARQVAGLLQLAIADAAAAPAAAQHQLDLAAFLGSPARLAEIVTQTPPGLARLNPILAGLHQNLRGYELYEAARRQERAGQLSKAIATYLQAGTAAPDQPQILTGLGLAYLLAGDPYSGRVHLQQAVRLQPAYYLSRMGLGYADLQLARYTDAIAELEMSVQLLPLVRNRFLLAESYQKNDQPDEAVALYRSVVQTDRHGKLGRTAAQRLRQLEN